MTLPIDPVWAEDGPRDEPSAAEIAEGFPCGPVSRELFNWLFWMLQSQINSLPADLPSAPGSAGLLNPDTMLIEAVRAAGAAQRAMTDTFQEWRLNSVVQNEISGASLSGSTYYVTLPPGRYNAIYGGAAHNAGSHVCRLYNRSLGVEIGHGLNCDSWVGQTNSTTNISCGATTFTLTETSQISLDHADFSASTSTPTFGDESPGIARTDAFLKLEREKGVA